jgi:hypothetical protein
MKNAIGKLPLERPQNLKKITHFRSGLAGRHKCRPYKHAEHVGARFIAP